MRQVRIGLLGCGTVGGGFVRLLAHERARIRSRFELDLTISKILVRDVDRERDDVTGMDIRGLLTDRPMDVLDDCDLVIEVLGGVHTAGTLVRRSMARGRHVVTANKALLAASATELFADAARNGVAIGFEASVCGGVPVIGALRRGLAGDSIESITGILNGTSNFILCRMAEGLGLPEALLCAQEAGFAEADPALDLSGEDAAQKMAVLAHVAFAEPVRRCSVKGIGSVSLEMIAEAHAAGSVIRQVAEVRRVAGGVELTVEPRWVPIGDPFARILDEQNAVRIRARAAGEIWLSGRGAGSMPTAAAVMSDVIGCGRQRSFA